MSHKCLNPSTITSSLVLAFIAFGLTACANPQAQTSDPRTDSSPEPKKASVAFFHEGTQDDGARLRRAYEELDKERERAERELQERIDEARKHIERESEEVRAHAESMQHEFEQHKHQMEDRFQHAMHEREQEMRHLHEELEEAHHVIRRLEEELEGRHDDGRMAWAGNDARIHSESIMVFVDEDGNRHVMRGGDDAPRREGRGEDRRNERGRGEEHSQSEVEFQLVFDFGEGEPHVIRGGGEDLREHLGNLRGMIGEEEMAQVMRAIRVELDGNGDRGRTSGMHSKMIMIMEDDNGDRRMFRGDPGDMMERMRVQDGRPNDGRRMERDRRPNDRRMQRNDRSRGRKMQQDRNRNPRGARNRRDTSRGSRGNRGQKADGNEVTSKKKSVAKKNASDKKKAAAKKQTGDKKKASAKKQTGDKKKASSKKQGSNE